MENRNETHPLLHSVYEETWRSKARKRCLRMPSQLTLTGVILGLFLVVVTLLIVFENVENGKEDGTDVATKLLASPFKFNKKIEDQSWQDKKDFMKNQKDYKWDKVNKGWKKYPGISGFTFTTVSDDRQERQKDNIETAEFPKIVDEYGKEIDDSLEDIFNLKMNDPSMAETNQAAMGKYMPPSIQKLNEDKMYIKGLLHSGTDWKLFDEGWKSLIDQGWKDSQIKAAIFQALREKRKELMKEEGLLQSPLNLNDIWNDIKDTWGKTIGEGKKQVEYQKNKGEKEMERQKTINDEWKNKMNILQSPTSDIKKFVKEDEGWQKLGELGWKNKMIEEALIQAWKERETKDAEKENLMQSPANIPSLFGKATEILKNLLQKGMNYPKSQMEMNDAWANEFGNIFQMSYKKWMENGKKKKKKTNKGGDFKDKQSDNTEQPVDIGNENEQPMESPMNFEDLMEIIDIIKENQKDNTEMEKHKKINDEWKKKGQDESEKQKGINEKWKKKMKDKESKNQKEINNQWKNKMTNSEEADEQKEINNEWKNKMNILQTAKLPDKKWKKVDDHWKTVIEHERNEYFGRNDADSTSNPKNRSPQFSMSLDNVKWENMDDGWKSLKEQGWTDQDLKDAVYKAWKEGDKLLESAMGSNSMKWKKVNDGYKKISKIMDRIRTHIGGDHSSTLIEPCALVLSATGPVMKFADFAILSLALMQRIHEKINSGDPDKGVDAPAKCPFSRYLTNQANTGDNMSIRCALIAEYVNKQFGLCIDMSLLPKECRHSGKPKCSSNKYRNIDGKCNNRIHPTWGNAYMPYARLIAPAYADGVSSIRKAKDGSPLPIARILSQQLYSKRLKPYSETSLIFMYYGLFVDHDMIQTQSNSDGLNCCDAKYIAHPEKRPTECLQIDIPRNDTFYGPKNVTCLNVLRSLPVIGECGGRREQLNQATSFLDASVVYGSDSKHAKSLRTFERGQLRTQKINHTPFMSVSDTTGYQCGTKDLPLKCFDAGDVRVNMLVELTVMHTMWYREHNRIATDLLKINPHWCDETLYQEARRIVIAEMQHITYRDFLPLLLGERAVDLYDLKIEKNKPYDGYDETIDPTVFNNFGSAALRLGHSMVPDVQLLKGKNEIEDIVPMHETFFNLKILYNSGLDLLLRGALTQRTQTVDSYITTEVRDHLFQPEGSDYGFDLAAVGLVRSRDHGLPPYLRWRAVCMLPEVHTWDDLYLYMDEERVDNLKSVYKSVEDIDLIPGALAERHEEGSLVGPTHKCLIGNQFRKTRKGDRYWFENPSSPGIFTEDQLDEIYNSNMARIICDNSDNITEIQTVPFKVPSDINPIVNCNSLPKVDLSKWKTKY